MAKKLFSFVIEEINGERGYSYTEYVYAEDYREARKLARDYARKFYGDEDQEGTMLLGKDAWGTYEVSWTLDGIQECKSIEVYPINGHPLTLHVPYALFVEPVFTPKTSPGRGYFYTSEG